MKPYLIGYILKCNYDEKFSKKCQVFAGEDCIEKMILNLIFTERLFIWKIIKENFNNSIERNPDLAKFDINTCHLCDKKLKIKQLRITAILHKKCLDMHIISVILNINLKKIM